MAGRWRKIRLFLKTHFEGRLPIVASGLALSAGMIVLYVIHPIFLTYLDYKIFDILLQKNHQTKTSNSVVMVDIDEESLGKYGQWPWPRYRMAWLLGNLQQLGASSVGLDIVFAEQDRTSFGNLQKTIKRDLGVAVTYNGLPAALMDNDVLFASTVARGPFVLGYYFKYGESSAFDEPCKPHQLNFTSIKRPGAPDPSEVLTDAPAPVCSVPVITNAATSSGFFNTLPDMDGILRRTPLLIHSNGNYYPSLGLATLLKAVGLNQVQLVVQPGGVESMRIGSTVVPLDNHGRMLLHYRGAGRSFPYYSAGDVLEGKVPQDAFKGKMVFIGTSATGLKDLRSTPFDPVFPGVEAHATVVDTILQQNFLSRPWFASILEFNTVLLVGIVSTLAIALTGAFPALAMCILLSGGLWGGAEWAFGTKGYYFSPLLPFLTLATNFAMLTLLKFRREEGNKKFLTATFKSYLSPELIEQMVADKNMPELGGEARTMTAYFTDIQKFSTFSEILTAPQLVELLNEYLSAMTDILIEEGGTLDKYEGDAIIAFFGAPLDTPDHALRACRVAIAMQTKLLELRERWITETELQDETRNVKQYPPEVWPKGSKWPVNVHKMLMRIGVNTGEMVVGNMGSAMRMNYTMMGDPVNLAARLEEGAKQFGIYTAVSQYTLDNEFTDSKGNTVKVRDSLEYRFIDRIAVVGKSEPVEVFELVALKGQLTEKEQLLFQLFADAMKLYHQTQWDEAREAFQKSLEVERFPEHSITPSSVFIGRCEMYKENPPVPKGEDWDGVYRMTKK